MLKIGLKHTSTQRVTERQTATTIGSGDLPVLATPAMIALMENAAMLAVADTLPEGCTTVGGHIATSHLRPTPPNASFSATAEVTEVDGKKITFKVTAHADNTLIGEGTHIRFVVDKAAFLSKMNAR